MSSLVRLILVLFALIAGAVIALIGFDIVHATDVKLFGWTGLVLMALALVALLPEKP